MSFGTIPGIKDQSICKGAGPWCGCVLRVIATTTSLMSFSFALSLSLSCE